MYHEVEELRNFYYASQLGRSVQRRIRSSIIERHSEIQGETLIGFGFASPFLRPFLSKFNSVVNLMPDAQGVMTWPPRIDGNTAANISVLTGETAWPMRAGSADFMIIAHALENSGNLSGLMDEIWRVLAVNGSAILILPHRDGLWARREGTPFAQGRPFSVAQAEQLVTNHGFEFRHSSGALFAPPMRSSWGVRLSKSWESVIGRRNQNLLAGVLIVEIQKPASPPPIRAKRREPVFATPGWVPAHGTQQKLGAQRYSSDK